MVDMSDKMKENFEETLWHVRGAARGDFPICATGPNVL